MSRVPLRVHGPTRHRSRWRLDVFADGKRTKLSFPTYGAALHAAHAMLTARGEVEITVENTDEVAASNSG